MPAAWQASGTLLGSTGADITPVIPAHQVEDILILLASSRVITETLTTPSGWLAVAGNPADVTAWRTYAFYRRAVSGSETNPLCDWSAAVGEKYGQVHVVRGAIRNVNPFQNDNLTADATSPITSAATSTTTGGDLIVCVGIGSDNASASMTSVTGTNPSSYTERHFSTIITGADATGWFFDGRQGVPGSTGTVTQTFVSTMPAAGVLLGAIMQEPLPPHAVTAVART